jgi:hypothetical protein
MKLVRDIERILSPEEVEAFVYLQLEVLGVRLYVA